MKCYINELRDIINYKIRYQNTPVSAISDFFYKRKINKYMKGLKSALSYQNINARDLIDLCYSVSLFENDSLISSDFVCNFKVENTKEERFYIYISNTIDTIRLEIFKPTINSDFRIDFSFSTESKSHTYSYEGTYYNRLEKNIKYRVDSLVWDGCLKMIEHMLNSKCVLSYPIYDNPYNTDKGEELDE